MYQRYTRLSIVNSHPVITQLAKYQNVTNCCRTVPATTFAQQMLKNSVIAETTSSATWFAELESDWYKKLFVFQDLVRDRKIKKPILGNTNTSGQYD